MNKLEEWGWLEAAKKWANVTSSAISRKFIHILIVRVEELERGLEAAKDETTEQAMQRYGLRDKLQAARELANTVLESNAEIPERLLKQARDFLKMLEGQTGQSAHREILPEHEHPNIKDQIGKRDA